MPCPYASRLVPSVFILDGKNDRCIIRLSGLNIFGILTAIKVVRQRRKTSYLDLSPVSL